MKEFIEKLIGRLEELKTFKLDLADAMSELMKKDRLDNYISKEEVIEIVNQLAEEYADNEVLSMVQMNNAFQKAKLEELKQIRADVMAGGWIPCSERLPEEELEKAMRERGKNAVFPVLATINKVHPISGEKYKIVSRAFYGHYNDKNFYNSCCDRLDVIAWKPLDAPYQPKGE